MYSMYAFLLYNTSTVCAVAFIIAAKLGAALNIAEYYYCTLLSCFNVLSIHVYICQHCTVCIFSVN